MKFFVYFTTFSVLLIGYFLNPLALNEVVYQLNNFILSVSDLFIILGLVCLFVEVIKSSIASSGSAYESALSVIVFVVFLILFITVPSANTSTFLILTIMSFIESIAGFIISVNVARRDVAVGF